MVDWALSFYPRMQAGGLPSCPPFRTQADGAATVILVSVAEEKRGAPSLGLASSQSFCWVAPLATSQFSLVKAGHSPYLTQGDRVVPERRPGDAW